MKTSKLALATCIVLAFGCSGCALSYFARFSPPIKQETEVILKENDFEIAETNLIGEASVWRLFGIIPLGDERLYSRALGDLYSKASSKIEGTPAQLMYWTSDETDLSLLLVTRKKVVFRADLVRFTK